MATSKLSQPSVSNAPLQHSSDGISRRYTVANFADKYPEFVTESSLRWLIFKADENGMNDFDVIERIGRRVLLHEDNFFIWLEAINAGSK